MVLILCVCVLFMHMSLYGPVCAWRLIGQKRALGRTEGHKPLVNVSVGTKSGSLQFPTVITFK